MEQQISLLEHLQMELGVLRESLIQHQAEMMEAAGDTAAAATQGGGNLGLTLFVFALAIFLGVELITKVPSQLHTPLMSGSNAISGITIVGALLAMQNVTGPAAVLLGLLAVITATVNVVGGYLVTDRMLGMFKTKKKEEA
jgi:NAD(P) transhydrogenase subunit alpha